MRWEMTEIAIKSTTDLQSVPFEAQTASISLVSAKAAKALAIRQKNFEAVEQAEIIILEQQRIIAAEYEKTFANMHGGDRKQDPRSGILKPEKWCELLGTSKTTVHRWKDKLLDDDKYQACLESVHKKTRQMVGMEQDGKNHTSSGNNDWYTPEEYIEAARVVLKGIDLDPASSEDAQQIVKAKRYYTKEQNGLDHEWTGTIWMNPPYSMPDIQLFVDKLVSSPVDEWIVLTNNSSDTTWFHSLLATSDLVCLTKGRIGFENTEGDVMATRQGQVFFYRGYRPETFYKKFNSFGAIITTVLEDSLCDF